jgi:hypothetical protein
MLIWFFLVYLLIVFLFTDIAMAHCVEYPVLIGLKNCRVREFRGTVTLSTGDCFRYAANPVIPQATELAEWYEQQDESILNVLPFLSANNSNNNAKSSSQLGSTPLMTLEEGMNLARGKNGKAEFFAVCLY